MRDFWQRVVTLDPVQVPRRARAAVLVPIYEDETGDVRVILTRRPDWMRTHPGDVVFPGGRIERRETIIETALREAEEEIGLVRESIEVLGGLPAVTTRDPRNLIVPVVARVVRPAEYVIETSEVAAVLEPRIVDLLDDSRWRTSRWLSRTMWFYDFPEGTMWGATAFMMRSLLGHLRGGAPANPPEPDIEIRRMTTDDGEHVRRTLLLATSQDDEGAGESEPLDRPELRPYHEGWGQKGDFGVVAFARGLFLGGAYARFFTEQHPGYGFVDEAIPEIAVGVESAHRGKLLGGRLLRALEDVAADAGVRRLSLSVEVGNRAIRLYERLGYEVFDRSDAMVRMVRTLPDYSG